MTNVTIPIDNHVSSPAICTLYYIVEYKLTSATLWEQLVPNPIEGEIEIFGLMDNQSYDVRAKRVCCNQSPSDWGYTTFTTTIP